MRPADRATAPRASGPLPRLHVVTDDSLLARGGWVARAVDVLEAGGADVCLHLRGPGTDGATVHRLAVELLPHARRVGARLVVNDRVDVALTASLDGAHVGGRSLPAAVARQLLGPVRWLGVSCHDAAEIAEARRGGADYVFLGTIFATPTHPGVAGMGLEGLAASLADRESCPVIAIGGIDPAGVVGVLGAGAHGIAVVRGVWAGRDPAAAVRRYIDEIERTAGAAALEQKGRRS